jgi:hypothetical protein
MSSTSSPRAARSLATSTDSWPVRRRVMTASRFFW